MATTRDLPLSQRTAATPTTKPFLPLAAPWFGPEEKREILETLDSDWITTGPRTQAFEAAFAELLGCREAVAVNSCTAALHVSLAALGVGTGDAVVTSPFTFAATANVVVQLAAEPVFVDITPDTYNLSPNQLRVFFEQQCEWSP